MRSRPAAVYLGGPDRCDSSGSTAPASCLGLTCLFQGFDTTCIPVAQLYVWESQIEVIARHLLLLQVAQDWELPIRQRANVFLEIFANTLVQASVCVLLVVALVVLPPLSLIDY